MKVLILDGYNLIHRARWSPVAKKSGGDHGITYIFLRSLKALIELHNPDKVYFVLEGYPKRRYEILESYKGTRKLIEDENFHSQKRDIIRFCEQHLPITTIRHPDYECDDVIGWLASNRHAKDECTVVSTDTDFIQLLQRGQQIQLYNPIKKSYLESPDYNYIFWKALRGDSSDNIEGFPGIGDKRAKKILSSQESLLEFVTKSEENAEKFAKNVFLINLHDYSLEVDDLEESDSTFEWSDCRKFFKERNFNSMLNNRYAVNFKEVFLRIKNGNS